METYLDKTTTFLWRRPKIRQQSFGPPKIVFFSLCVRLIVMRPDVLMLSRCITRQVIRQSRSNLRLKLANRKMASRAVDPTSLSNPHECKVKNLSWNFRADFERKVRGVGR
jgi:hypothetical protein